MYFDVTIHSLSRSISQMIRRAGDVPICRSPLKETDESCYSAITMVSDISDSPSKLWFPARIRALRAAAGQKQRQVAEAIGMKERSYANAESSNFKRMRLERVHRLAKHHGLSNAETLELVNGWESLPESPYNQRMARPWAERNARRAKIKNHDQMKLALLEMVALIVTNVDDPGRLCTCSEVDLFSDDQQPAECELCDALRLLGMTGWTNLDDVIANLAKAQEGMVTG